MSKRAALGKGLEALIPQLNVDEADVVSSVEIGLLRPNPYQPRRVFNEEKLEELKASIQQHGIIQPLIVRKSSVRGYDIVAGERRFRAAQMAGLHEVPVVVRDFSDVELMEVAIIENLQREDLNAIEIAEAYANLMEKCHLTQEQLAERVGQSRSHVANMLRLLQLPEVVREHVSRGTLSMGHARALLAVEDKEAQVQLARRAAAEEMSVRKLEEVVYRPKTNVSRETKRRPNELAYRRYEEQFRSVLGTSVKIHPGKKRGKIEIEYFSEEDLDRILHLLSSSSTE
ncbi:ParB/RepB/Spo0J family partition protein [Alicyclobacillus cycloheptanicus]|uniref:ParB family chromosome partitioning protein n=1 Tax=Alicyclobacillus cycloheptanicus TaxID=1457 RepID=A0ABT9XKV7_9BACL|nr:ParB/RepB/Spo0J family partition protein [Alicyclobacillus cycloheptanicus]MDQ0190942.1 ParB family chromosome partitioning protein [Alicyclobacillus cycloheptanicus]WDM02390.1 ParB/RepB/Spo0J family partition protein [Alicyclobacillus cycloheptanicus]